MDAQPRDSESSDENAGVVGTECDIEAAARRIALGIIVETERVGVTGG